MRNSLLAVPPPLLPGHVACTCVVFHHTLQQHVSASSANQWTTSDLPLIGCLKCKVQLNLRHLQPFQVILHT
uniref:Uncharacterized protein n=1 Tax=Leersia perrieri TaxID=77586 RepID=A0A0D9WV16_9ORYZ